MQAGAGGGNNGKKRSGSMDDPGMGYSAAGGKRPGFGLSLPDGSTMGRCTNGIGFGFNPPGPGTDASHPQLPVTHSAIDLYNIWASVIPPDPGSSSHSHTHSRHPSSQSQSQSHPQGSMSGTDFQECLTLLSSSSSSSLSSMYPGHGHGQGQPQGQGSLSSHGYNGQYQYPGSGGGGGSAYPRSVGGKTIPPSALGDGSGSPRGGLGLDLLETVAEAPVDIEALEDGPLSPRQLPMQVLPHSLPYTGSGSGSAGPLSNGSTHSHSQSGFLTSKLQKYHRHRSQGPGMGMGTPGGPGMSLHRVGSADSMYSSSNSLHAMMERHISEESMSQWRGVGVGVGGGGGEQQGQGQGHGGAPGSGGGMETPSSEGMLGPPLSLSTYNLLHHSHSHSGNGNNGSGSGRVGAGMHRAYSWGTLVPTTTSHARDATGGPGMDYPGAEGVEEPGEPEDSYAVHLSSQLSGFPAMRKQMSSVSIDYHPPGPSDNNP